MSAYSKQVLLDGVRIEIGRIIPYFRVKNYLLIENPGFNRVFDMITPVVLN